VLRVIVVELIEFQEMPRFDFQEWPAVRPGCRSSRAILNYSSGTRSQFPLLLKMGLRCFWEPHSASLTSFLFKSSLMSTSPSLQWNPRPPEIFYIDSDSVCFLAPSLLLWERSRLVSAMADVIPHHAKGPVHHLLHNWRQVFPFHKLWILNCYTLNVVYF